MSLLSWAQQDDSYMKEAVPARSGVETPDSISVGEQGQQFVVWVVGVFQVNIT